jgi:hypothetical protein
MPLANAPGVPCWARLGLALWLLAANASGWAQVVSVAEVIFAQGVVSAQRGAEQARLLGKGNPLYEGDIIATGQKAFAVIQFTDMSRLTLRPESAFQINAYSHGGEQDNALLRLVRGGLRAVTGLIAKRSPDAVRIATPTATIGIRGTDFDARLCDQQCAAEQKMLGARKSTVSAVVARGVLVEGAVTVESAAGAVRSLALGGPVYTGDTLQTGNNALAVLVFRDDSRVTLQAGTRFKVEEYRYEPEGARPDSVLLRLVRGSMRAVTGLIAKREPQSFHVATVIATIGVRGSGMDVSCEGYCADGNRTALPSAAVHQRGDGLFVHSWQGGVELRFDSQRLAIDENQTALFASGTLQPVLLPAIPEFIRVNPAPRPDRVPVGLQDLFGAQTGEPGTPGLYVFVRDGHVSLLRDGQTLDLGGGEAGYADPTGILLTRLVTPPTFLEFDPYPRPDEFDERVRRIIELITDGQPGAPRGFECEVR